MMIIIFLFLFWLVCSLPFVVMGIPSEASAILGLITEIIIIVCKSSKSNEKSTQQPTKRRGSGCGSSNDDEIDEMVMLDMMDGDLDGEFDFFDKD